MQEIYIAFDVEADGPAPSVNNCLQMAFVAFTIDGEISAADTSSFVVDTLDLCFESQPGKVSNADTMEFWGKFPEIYKKIAGNKKPVADNIIALSSWLNELSKKYKIVRFVAGPSSYDWQWVNNIYEEYPSSERYELPYSAECSSSLTRALVYMGRDKAEIEEYCQQGADPYLPHTHYALDDALREAYCYTRLRKLLRETTISQ